MNAVHRRRFIVMTFLVVGVATTLTVAVVALQNNMEFFYLPSKIVNGEAPVGQRIRAGGMVVPNSIVHDDSSLDVTFSISDMQGSAFQVHYSGLLPALFNEGQGSIVGGTLRDDGVFQAETVLAKHDETYVPPELEELVHNSDT